METRNILIEKLKHLPNNAKNHTPDQIEKIKNSITSFGFNDPLGVWQDEKLKKQGKYYVVTGNGTLEACKQLEFKEIPCNDLSNLSETEMRAYAIAHNSTTLRTGFDDEILAGEIANLDYNFYDFGLVLPANSAEDFDMSEIELKEKVKYPVTIIFNEDEHETFEAYKLQNKAKSDADGFRKLLGLK